MGLPALFSLCFILIRSMSILEFSMLLLLCLVIVVNQYLKIRRQYYSLPNWPVLRNLPSLICNINRLNDWTVEILNGCATILFNGPVFTGMEIVFTCNPQNVEYMMKTNFDEFNKGPHFAEIFDFLGNGMFVADGESWSEQRKMAVTRFASKKFQSFCSEKNDEVVTEGLVPVLEDAVKRGSTIDLQEVFKRLAFDVTFASVLGRNPGFLSVNFVENEFFEALDTLTRVAFLRHCIPSLWWKVMRLLGLGWERQYKHSWRVLDRHLTECISAKKQDLTQGKKISDDLLATYMSSSTTSIGGDEENYCIDGNENFLRDTALTFIFAGQDTFSSGLTWFFYMLSKSPSVEAKILEELKLVMDSNNNEEKKKKELDLRKLKYLEAAILESMRLNPPVPIEHKSAKKKDMLPDGTIVGPGKIILFSMFAMGRMKWIWGDDCLDFKPERWIDIKTGNLKHEPSSKYPVFNVGPRACLGKRMGMTVMKTVIAAVILDFHVEVVEGQSVRPVPSITLKMKDGLKAKTKLSVQTLEEQVRCWYLSTTGMPE
ncbi:hypothetical protein H6P81_005035 [Aristolochia fimbriata]|uniref:Cytochrome P450 n=1 Tax=Aristolochia fimbriata TaxID=158543 RepID=A0AAV7EWV4_ARIFI|nr:hypothetical protein H6P81_005035 [Aristolochia fimbriata]